MVHVDGGLTAYRFGRVGGPQLLLVHGLTEAGTAWPDAVCRWKGRYDVLAVDLRGHGRSPRFDGSQLARAREVWLADVLAVLRSLPSPPVVVGHSLGGLLALRAADAEPALVRGLVLEDPSRPPPEDVVVDEFVAATEEFLDRFVDGGEAEIARMSVETRWSADEIAAWAQCKPLVDRRMVREGTVLGPGEWEEVFARLVVPTLVVAPADGEMAPDESLVDNPLVQVRRLEGVGHCVRRDDPEAYHAVVDPFIESWG